MSIAQKQIGQYLVIGALGSGSSAKVKLARNVNTNQQVAIKVLKKENLKNRPNLFKKLQREIALMSLFEHPHILRLYEVFESERHLHIVLEFAENRELFDMLVERKRIPESEGMELFRQIIYALEYLHQHGICHRDLKPENILLDANNNIKIADFGFARWMKSNVAKTSCGSPHYAAPEVIRAQPYSGKAADVWSAGVILYAMLAGRLPFDDPALRNLLLKIKKGEFDMPQFDDDIQNLIYRMLVVDPTKRITIEEIKKHPAFLAGLPDGYIVPTPLPLPQINDPIAPDSIQPQLWKVLMQIGYTSEDELKEDLLSQGQTMAKVFHFMLTRQIDRSLLPWEEAKHYQVEGIDNELEEKEYDGTDAELSMAVNVPTMPGITAPESVYSLAKKADWSIGDALMIVYEQEDAVENLKTTSAPLMLAVQCILNDVHYDWFHPDDMRIIARSPTGDYVTCDAEYTDIGVMTLHVRMEKGSEHVFQALMKRVKECLQQRDGFDELEDEGADEMIPTADD